MFVMDQGMLLFLNIVQLLLYIGLLALLGQGLLFVLAGAKRHDNFFYQLLQVLTKPFTWTARKLTPKLVADRHVPVVAFFWAAILYAVVTFEKLSLCATLPVGACTS
jgi:hypothetical protein